MYWNTHTYVYMTKHQNPLIECLKSLKNRFNLISIQDLMQQGSKALIFRKEKHLLRDFSFVFLSVHSF